MIDLKRTHSDKTLGRSLAAGTVIDQEGLILCAVLENGEEVAKLVAAPAGTDKVLGFAKTANSTPARTSERWNCLTEARDKERQAQVQQQQMSKLQYFQSRCDAYGFKRGTTEFAQCLQQAEAQQSMDNSIQMQQIQNNNINAQENFRRAGCYATGRLDC